jgi:hypothetical protein
MNIWTCNLKVLQKRGLYSYDDLTLNHFLTRNSLFNFSFKIKTLSRSQARNKDRDPHAISEKYYYCKMNVCVLNHILAEYWDEANQDENQDVVIQSRSIVTFGVVRFAGALMISLSCSDRGICG